MQEVYLRAPIMSHGLFGCSPLSCYPHSGGDATCRKVSNPSEDNSRVFVWCPRSHSFPRPLPPKLNSSGRGRVDSISGVTSFSWRTWLQLTGDVAGRVHFTCLAGRSGCCRTARLFCASLIESVRPRAGSLRQLRRLVRDAPRTLAGLGSRCRFMRLTNGESVNSWFQNWVPCRVSLPVRLNKHC